jgi:hypothetical protein
MTVYNIYYWEHYDEDIERQYPEYIDQTQVDELDETLIWDLFREFGHIRTEKMFYSYTTEEEV